MIDEIIDPIRCHFCRGNGGIVSMCFSNFSETFHAYKKYSVPRKQQQKKHNTWYVSKGRPEETVSVLYTS